MGRKAKVLYDEDTPNEKWLVSVIVEQLDDTNYRLYFPDDDVSDLGTDEFEPIETEKKTQIGKKVQVAYKTRNGRDKTMWKGIIVTGIYENKCIVNFTQDREIAEIDCKLLQFL